jgi:hypothetical protein
MLNFSVLFWFYHISPQKIYLESRPYSLRTAQAQRRASAVDRDRKGTQFIRQRRLCDPDARTHGLS